MQKAWLIGLGGEHMLPRCEQMNKRSVEEDSRAVTTRFGDAFRYSNGSGLVAQR
jgi:hypothetical protein